jgi:chromosome segregation ATPase
MTRQERIDALKRAIAAVESALGQTSSALRTSVDGDEILELTSQLADLRAERQKLQFELANLEGASDELAGLSGEASARVRALENEVNAAVLNRATISAAIDATNTILVKVAEIRATVG